MMTLREMLRLAPVMAVATIEDVAHAVPMARALLDGGLRMMEVSITHPAGLGSIERIAAEVGELMVGAGTVLNLKDLKRATRAGAQFATSPGFLPKLSDAAEIPHLPGAATATEIMRAADHGHDIVRLYPAELAGGVAALRIFGEIFPQIGFCAQGGITFDNAPHYLAQRNVLSIAADWVVPGRLVTQGNWEHVAFLAHETAECARTAG